MRNDVNIKTTWVRDNGINEIYFDFHNTEGKYIGNIIVTEKGKVSWSLLDLMYEKNIFGVVDYIMGNNDRKLLHFETSEEDSKRWDRAKIYIATHNVVLNRGELNKEENIKNMR